MQIITAHNGKLHTVRSGGLRGLGLRGVGSLVDAGEPKSGEHAATNSASEKFPLSPETQLPVFRTGIGLWDGLAPGQAFALGMVHELLYPPRAPPPQFVALLLAIAAARVRGGQVAWSDPEGTLYPPAVARAGLPLDRLLILRPKDAANEVWAAAECLRCPGVSATIVSPGRLSRVQARRLQLAAERGGGAGVFLRPHRANQHYAAATRWLVVPEPGTRTAQRWKVELLHGHGGQIHQSIILELSRDPTFHPDRTSGPHASPPPHPVSAYEPVADRPTAARAG